MFRPCPKCGNSNHISARICPCGFQLVGVPKPELRPGLEEATALPPTAYRETSAIRSPDLPEQPPPLSVREELEKQAIREALLAEESQKPAAGAKLKINFKRSALAAGFAALFGALPLLALFDAFAGFTENSEAGREKNQSASRAGTGRAPEVQPLAANKAAGGEPGVEGKVVDVGSGDTITIADGDNQQYRVKLEGIDAPELEQDFGREAQKHLFTLVFGKTVQVSRREAGADGVAVGKVSVNGKNASLEQLKAGLAWHDRDDALEATESDLYAYHETTNKRNSFGLWAAAKPEPPWEYRGEAENAKAGENQAAVIGDARGEIAEAAPDAEAEAKTTIVQETRNTVEKIRTASAETASKPPYTKLSKSASRIPPPSRVSKPVFSGFENKIIVVPRTVTARCGDGTLIYGAAQNAICAGRGGAAERLDASTPPTKTKTRPRIYNPAPRVRCFVIEGGKKVYLKTCGD